MFVSLAHHVVYLFGVLLRLFAFVCVPVVFGAPCVIIADLLRSSYGVVAELFRLYIARESIYFSKSNTIEQIVKLCKNRSQILTKLRFDFLYTITRVWGVI